MSSCPGLLWEPAPSKRDHRCSTSNRNAGRSDCIYLLANQATLSFRCFNGKKSSKRTSLHNRFRRSYQSARGCHNALAMWPELMYPAAHSRPVLSVCSFRSRSFCRTRRWWCKCISCSLIRHVALGMLERTKSPTMIYFVLLIWKPCHASQWVSTVWRAQASLLHVVVWAVVQRTIQGNLYATAVWSVWLWCWLRMKWRDSIFSVGINSTLLHACCLCLQ